MALEAANKREACSHLNGCKLWQTFRSNSKFFWIKQYCEGPKQPDCARFKASEAGQPVSDTLLPNGDKLA